MSTLGVLSLGDLPDAIGKTAARALQQAGIDSLAKVSEHTEKELLALHGVGPKAIQVLGAALAAQGRAFRQDP